MGIGLTEPELLRKAAEKLYEQTGQKLEILDEQHRLGQGIVDAIAQMPGTANRTPYLVEIKRNITKTTLGLTLQQIDQYKKIAGKPYRGMLITEYVNPNLAERLKELDFAFIDTAGNAYINDHPLYIYMCGKKPEYIDGQKLTTTSAFRPSGLRLLFILLCNPNLINAPYRELAKLAHVALGTVGWVFADLRELGFLLENGHQPRRLIRHTELVKKWVAAYPIKFRPKLVKGLYRAENHLWWRNADIANYGAQWGGEIAGAIMTDNLKPQVATIYAGKNATKLLLDHALRKDPQGDIEIMERFWEPDTINETYGYREDLVPPLLVYADLIATADDRNIETAKIIYDERIARHIQQD